MKFDEHMQARISGIIREGYDPHAVRSLKLDWKRGVDHVRRQIETRMRMARKGARRGEEHERMASGALTLAYRDLEAEELRIFHADRQERGKKEGSWKVILIRMLGFGKTEEREERFHDYKDSAEWAEKHLLRSAPGSTAMFYRVGWGDPNKALQHWYVNGLGRIARA